MPLWLTHRRITSVLQVILLLEGIAALWEGQWFTALITAAIITVSLIPRFLEQRYRVFIPAQLQLMAITFVFGALFLGEVHGYYTRFWWWDLLLHTTSGFLLGIVGFLLVYVLNEVEEIDVHMKPGFVALFAFLFALGIGALWEIFEFTMDALFSMNMQKSMLGDDSGLTDTMFDLMVDALGALIIAVWGYRHLKSGRKASYLERWIDQFVAKNRHFFDRD